jgi:chromosome segregation ATPase
MKKTTFYTLLCTTIMVSSLSKAAEQTSDKTAGFQTPKKSAIPSHVTASTSVLSPYSSADAQVKMIEQNYKANLGTPILKKESERTLRESGFNEEEVAQFEPSVTSAAKSQRDQKKAADLQPHLEKKADAKLKKERLESEDRIAKDKERHEKERAELLASQLDQSSALQEAEQKQLVLSKKIEALSKLYKDLTANYQSSVSDALKTAEDRDRLKAEAETAKLQLEEAKQAKAELELTVDAIKSKLRIQTAPTQSAGNGIPLVTPSNGASGGQVQVPQGGPQVGGQVQVPQGNAGKKAEEGEKFDIDI